MVSKAKRAEGEKAQKDIERLFLLAKENAGRDDALAHRYVTLARESAKRHRISLRHHNNDHCRKCCVFFTGKTLRVRVRPTGVSRTCIACGNVTRILRREKTIREKKPERKRLSSQARAKNS